MVSKVNIKCRIKARLMEPNILWERIAELGVLQTGLVSLRLACFLTRSKEVQI